MDKNYIGWAEYLAPLVMGINNSAVLIGDRRVLNKFGQLLIEFDRKSDLISRFGGEEFLILLPDINQERTLNFAQRLHNLANKIIVADKALTVSIGVSFFDGEMSFDEIVQKADIALYKAKSLGRNRTEVFSLV